MTSAAGARDTQAGSPVVVLIGPPGAGKTSVGAALAALLGASLRDTDADVEAAAGRSAAEIFVDDGETRFRDLEADAVSAALASHDGVLAIGGGAVMDPRSEAALASYAAHGGVVVFLDVSLAHAGPRVGFNQARPLSLGNLRAQWQTLMAARRPVYSRLATHHVSTDGTTPAQVADQVAALLRATTHAPEAPRE
ncbi:MAG: shikimate kinase [Cellulomonadaceae bacterium]|nr:shikimate kinase [Cellulomonadaceae bacterium]